MMRRNEIENTNEIYKELLTNLRSILRSTKKCSNFFTTIKITEEK